MNLTTVDNSAIAEQEIKTGPAVEQSFNSKVTAKKTLLNFTGYLTLAAATLPLVFMAVVFFSIASTGNLGDSILKVLLG
ncbi:MAG: hypothetical protein KAJ92_00500 [Gammaproteobacteria bacterium]|nr:hypothetical protein [Gammaproteobacteria bacterium]